MNRQQTKRGFTIIELMVGILIFTMGCLSAYLLVYTALNSSRNSRNEIIAANLARERLELVRNNRDNNWLQMLSWDKLNNAGQEGKYLTGGYYIIENNFGEIGAQIKITKLSDTFSEENKYLINPADYRDKTQLCLDSLGRYTHDCTNNKPTRFYSYIKVEPLKTKTNNGTKINVNDAYKIIANIVNSEKGFIRYHISTIITDWKK